MGSGYVGFSESMFKVLLSCKYSISREYLIVITPSEKQAESLMCCLLTYIYLLLRLQL